MITEKPLVYYNQEFYDEIRMYGKEIRNYEVSLWTLQDEFITVLKWPDIEQKGRIENPIMTLNVDGTETFECSIPMYIFQDGKLIENPNWYNVYNGNLIINLRKLKVIINKNDSQKRGIFEFLITEITETHENDILTCEIKADGLAFHELGRIGYKYNLSQELFENEYNAWAEGDQTTPEPVCNLQYWLKKIEIPSEESIYDDNPEVSRLETEIRGVRNSRRWYYRIEMDWSSFNNNNQFEGKRMSNKIYEEGYNTQWDSETLAPIAGSFINYKEKERPVTAENSNIFNITQNLAETFGIYCRYEYGHDENYYINSRTIVFYNNFNQEKNGPLSLTYPYSSSKITRTLDTTDIVTKLYVLNVDNDNTAEGVNSIMRAPVNPTREDYILNFDYALKIGAITEEQYQQIQKDEIKLRKLNIAMEQAQDELSAYDIKINDIKSDITVAENSKKAAEEQRDQTRKNQQAYNSRNGTGNGIVSITKSNPCIGIVVTEGNNNYVRLNSDHKGIIASTIKVYTTRQCIDIEETEEIEDESLDLDEEEIPTMVTNFSLEYDNAHNIIKLINLDTTCTILYLTYDYKPSTYYNSIYNDWVKKVRTESEKITELTLYNNSLEARKELIKADFDANYEEKKNIIKAFEQMMGPALREGYWQPDDYKNTNVYQNKSFILSQSTAESDGWQCKWDNNLLDSEQDLYYELGVNQNQIPYECINLSNLSNEILQSLSDYSVVWNPINYSNSINYGSMKIGSQAEIHFIREKSNHINIIPILLLTDVQHMTDKEIQKMKSTARIAKYDINTGKISGSSINVNWMTSISNYEMIYPRLIYSKTDLNINDTNLKIHLNNNNLNRYYDYSILTDLQDNGELQYLITIKPETYIKYRDEINYITINYSISNANSQIYMDALEVSKENAFPKVSYTIVPTLWNRDIIQTLHLRLANLVMINDVDLKFEDTFGYISQISLHLDDPVKDEIEIKNYKSKFEDVFSTIMAQTEAMKTRENLVNSAIAGSIPLTSEALQESLNPQNNTIIMNNYLNTYSDQLLSEKIEPLFTELGKILSGLNKPLDYAHILDENMTILNGFNRNIQDSLFVNVYRSKTRPEMFKVNDIWLKIRDYDPVNDANNENLEIIIENDIPTYVITNRYVAVVNSTDQTGIINDYVSPTSGFVETYDGNLASISGAAINLNTMTGVIDITAKNNINLWSGNNIDIKANSTVNIVGNDEVNICGTRINMFSTSNINGKQIGGIYLKALGYDDTAQGIYSEVSLIPESVTMRGTRLQFEAGSSITMLSSNNDNTSALQISPDEGIWLGANAGVRIFGGSGSVRKVFVGPYRPDNFMKGDVWIRTTKTTNHNELSINYYYNNFSNPARGYDIIDGKFRANKSWNDIYTYQIDSKNAGEALIDGTNEQYGPIAERVEIQEEINNDGIISTHTIIKIKEGYKYQDKPDLCEDVWILEEQLNSNANDIAYLEDKSNSGALVELNNEHLLLGFSAKNNNNSNVGVVELNNEKILLTTGAQTGIIDGTNNSLSGVLITKDSIGLSVSDNNNRSTVIISGKNILLASEAVSLLNNPDIINSQASIVSISGDGIIINSSANLYVNTENVKIFTNGNTSNNTTYYFSIGNVANNNGMAFSTEQGLVVSGNITATTFIAQYGEGNKFMATSNKFGFFTSANDAIVTFGADSMIIASNYKIDAQGGLVVNSTNFKVNSENDASEIFYVGNNNVYLKYYNASTQENPNWVLESNNMNIIANSFTAKSQETEIKIDDEDEDSLTYINKQYLKIDNSHMGFYKDYLNTDEEEYIQGEALLEIRNDGLYSTDQIILYSGKGARDISEAAAAISLKEGTFDVWSTNTSNLSSQETGHLVLTDTNFAVAIDSKPVRLKYIYTYIDEQEQVQEVILNVPSDDENYTLKEIRIEQIDGAKVESRLGLASQGAIITADYIELTNNSNGSNGKMAKIIISNGVIQMIGDIYINGRKKY